MTAMIETSQATTDRETLACQCGSTNVWTTTRPTRPLKSDECIADCRECGHKWDVTDLYNERYADYYSAR